MECRGRWNGRRCGLFGCLRRSGGLLCKSEGRIEVLLLPDGIGASYVGVEWLGWRSRLSMAILWVLR